MSYLQRDDQLTRPPDVLARAFRIERMIGGKWQPLTGVNDNHQRLVRLPVEKSVEGVRFILDAAVRVLRRMKPQRRQGLGTRV